MGNFIGRTNELKELQRLLKKKSASLVVMRGRRRIGKSRLIKEFAKDLPSVYFSGLAPPGTTPQMQRDEFARVLCSHYRLPPFKSEDWGELFHYLSPHVAKGRKVVVFDEISWMADRDPTFLAKLKNAWDLYFSENPKLILILCGSVSSWIERNILSQTGFVGRISLDFVVEELPIADCAKFWRGKGRKISPYEILKTLSVTGGVPKYLEEIYPDQTAEQNIQELCFNPKGLLFREFEQIFSELFSSRNKIYSNIVSYLVDHPCELEDIRKKLNLQKGGTVTEYLEDLTQAGFISSDLTWSIKTQKKSNLRTYRLKDNYLRFYLKYIAPHAEQIKDGTYELDELSYLPAWSSIAGLQFENLILANRKAIFQALEIRPQTVLCSGPFFQRRTSRQKGCQIDLLIQTKHRTLYLCEIKFSGDPISSKVLKEVQQKLESIHIPRGFSIRTVLIHVNGTSAQIKEANFFDAIIDFSQLVLPAK